MKKAKKILALVICLVLTLSLFASIAVSAVVDEGEQTSQTVESVAKETAYPKTNTNIITGEGGNPSEISGIASALATEKEWYEYITYSSEPVSFIPIDSRTKVVFYDPYDYSNALLMEVDESVTEWSSANSITASYTTGNSMETGYGYSTSTDTSIQVTAGKDEYGSTTTNTGDVVTKYDTTTTIEISELGAYGGIDTPFMEAIITGNFTNGTEQVSGTTIATEETANETKGWSTVANRITTSTGTSSSQNKVWSTNDSVTISSTYDATYFNSQGSPLQWKIIKYSVKMPMRYEIQYLIDGKWFGTGSAYCLLTTVQGTCRSWLNNNVAYLEHWGTGEAVTRNDFWSGFFTKESLINAYKNKLYPDN